MIDEADEKGADKALFLFIIILMSILLSIILIEIIRYLFFK